MQINQFHDEKELNKHLAQQLVTLLASAIEARGRAYCVVSGGKTPVHLFQLLAESDIPWTKVTVCLADERCVGVADPARNERMVKENLLQKRAQDADLISLYNEDLNLVDNLSLVEHSISALPLFDAVILGMGEDGHTASLFPCSDELEHGLSDSASSVLLVNPKTAPYQRISLSKKRLLQSRAIFLQLLGEKKYVVLQEALVTNNPSVMPICAFLNHHHANLHVMYAPNEE